MAAIKKEQLEELERTFNLQPDGLSYQHRCSRIAAYMDGRGDQWTPPQSTQKAVSTQEPQRIPLTRQHPLYGIKFLIAPMMTPDKNRALAFEERIGHEITVSEFNAGAALHDAANDELDRMSGDYVIEHENIARPIYALTTFPKIGTEITWTCGVDLAPVVRGNDGTTGYIWSFPRRTLTTVKDGVLIGVDVQGLLPLIEQCFPTLIAERKFAGKPMMSYIDGVTLAASIPLTHAVLQEARRKALLDEKAGLV